MEKKLMILLGMITVIACIGLTACGGQKDDDDDNNNGAALLSLLMNSAK